MPRNSGESACWATLLLADCFDDSEVAVGTVHGVEHVPTHLLSSRAACTGAGCQTCRELRQADDLQHRKQAGEESNTRDNGNGYIIGTKASAGNTPSM